MLMIPGRPSANALTWWAMCEAAQSAQFQIEGPGGGGTVPGVPLKTLNDGLPGYDLYGVMTQGLAADSPYHLTHPASGASANSRTLPVKGTGGNQSYTPPAPASEDRWGKAYGIQV